VGFFDNYFFVFIVIFIGLALWNFFEQRRLGSTEGEAKRGVRVWVDSLSWETCQKLESLPPITEVKDGFIRKDGREVLIAEEHPIISFGKNRQRLRYIGYINLSDPDSRIEFRTTLSGLLSSVFGLLFVLWIFSNFFLGIPKNGFPLFFILFPLVFLAIYVGSFVYNHYQERKRIMKILNRATGFSQVNLPDSHF